MHNTLLDWPLMDIGMSEDDMHDLFCK